MDDFAEADPNAPVTAPAAAPAVQPSFPTHCSGGEAGDIMFASSSSDDHCVAPASPLTAAPTALPAADAFGDFDDFESAPPPFRSALPNEPFPTPAAALSVASVALSPAVQPAADDFDFGDFEDAPTPAAAQPPSQLSPASSGLALAPATAPTSAFGGSATPSTSTVDDFDADFGDFEDASSSGGGVGGPIASSFSGASGEDALAFEDIYAPASASDGATVLVADQPWISNPTSSPQKSGDLMASSFGAFSGPPSATAVAPPAPAPAPAMDLLDLLDMSYTSTPAPAPATSGASSTFDVFSFAPSTVPAGNFTATTAASTSSSSAALLSMQVPVKGNTTTTISSSSTADADDDDFGEFGEFESPGTTPIAPSSSSSSSSLSSALPAAGSTAGAMSLPSSTNSSFVGFDAFSGPSGGHGQGPGQMSASSSKSDLGGSFGSFGDFGGLDYSSHGHDLSALVGAAQSSGSSGSSSSSSGGGPVRKQMTVSELEITALLLSELYLYEEVRCGYSSRYTAPI